MNLKKTETSINKRKENHITTDSIQEAYEKYASHIRKRNKEISLLMLDDNYLPHFLEWACKNDLSEILLFLLEVDFVHFRSVSDISSSFARLIDCYLNPTSSLKKLLKRTTVDLITDVVSLKVPLNCVLGVVCELAWDYFLEKCENIGNSSSLRKSIIGESKLELLTVLRERSLRVYLEDFLLENSTDINILLVWRDCRNLLSSLDQYKINILQTFSLSGTNPSSSYSNKSTSFLERVLTRKKTSTTQSPLMSSGSNSATSVSANIPFKNNQRSKRSATLTSTRDMPSDLGNDSSPAAFAEADASFGADFSDPYAALKTALRGVKRLQHQKYFHASNTTPSSRGQHSFGTSSMTLSNNPPGTTPTATSSAPPPNGASIPVPVSVISDSNKIDLAQILEMTASMDVDSMDLKFVRGCLGRLERWLLGVERQTFQRLQTLFPAFLLSIHCTRLVAYKIGCQSPRIQSYLSHTNLLNKISGSSSAILISPHSQLHSNELEIATHPAPAAAHSLTVNPANSNSNGAATGTRTTSSSGSRTVYVDYSQHSLPKHSVIAVGPEKSDPLAVLVADIVLPVTAASWRDMSIPRVCCLSGVTEPPQSLSHATGKNMIAMKLTPITQDIRSSQENVATAGTGTLSKSSAGRGNFPSLTDLQQRQQQQEEELPSMSPETSSGDIQAEGKYCIRRLLADIGLDPEAVLALTTRSIPPAPSPPPTTLDDKGHQQRCHHPIPALGGSLSPEEDTSSPFFFLDMTSRMEMAQAAESVVVVEREEEEQRRKLQPLLHRPGISVSFFHSDERLHALFQTLLEATDPLITPFSSNVNSPARSAFSPTPSPTSRISSQRSPETGVDLESTDKQSSSKTPQKLSLKSHSGSSFVFPDPAKIPPAISLQLFDSPGNNGVSRYGTAPPPPPPPLRNKSSSFRSQDLNNDNSHNIVLFHVPSPSVLNISVHISRNEPGSSTTSSTAHQHQQQLHHHHQQHRQLPSESSKDSSNQSSYRVVVILSTSSSMSAHSLVAEVTSEISLAQLEQAPEILLGSSSGGSGSGGSGSGSKTLSLLENLETLEQQDEKLTVHVPLVKSTFDLGGNKDSKSSRGVTTRIPSFRQLLQVEEEKETIIWKESLTDLYGNTGDVRGRSTDIGATGTTTAAAAVSSVPKTADFELSDIIQTLTLEVSVRTLFHLLLNRNIVLLSSSSALLTAAMLTLPRLCRPFSCQHVLQTCYTESSLATWWNHFTQTQTQSSLPPSRQPPLPPPPTRNGSKASLSLSLPVHGQGAVIAEGMRGETLPKNTPYLVGSHLAVYRAVTSKGNAAGGSLKSPNSSLLDLFQQAVVIDLDACKFLASPHGLEKSYFPLHCSLFNTLAERLRNIAVSASHEVRSTSSASSEAEEDDGTSEDMLEEEVEEEEDEGSVITVTTMRKNDKYTVTDDNGLGMWDSGVTDHYDENRSHPTGNGNGNGNGNSDIPTSTTTQRKEGEGDEASTNILTPSNQSSIDYNDSDDDSCGNDSRGHNADTNAAAAAAAARFSRRKLSLSKIKDLFVRDPADVETAAAAAAVWGQSTRGVTAGGQRGGKGGGKGKGSTVGSSRTFEDAGMVDVTVTEEEDEEGDGNDRTVVTPWRRPNPVKRTNCLYTSSSNSDLEECTSEVPSPESVSMSMDPSNRPDVIMTHSHSSASMNVDGGNANDINSTKKKEKYHYHHHHHHPNYRDTFAKEMIERNIAVEWSFRSFLGDVVLNALPICLQHYPRQTIVGCDLDKLLSLVRPSFKVFCNELVLSPVFVNLLVRHGVLMNTELVSPPPPLQCTNNY